MHSNRTTNTNNNNHRRQWSEGVMSTDRSTKLYKDDDRQLVQYLVNEYLLEGSNEILDLIRNCPNEYFEALVDFIWNPPLQATENSDEDVSLYSQRSSLLSSASTNVYRYPARRRLAILFIEIFKLLSIPTLQNGRFDIQRQNRILCFPHYIRHLINFEPDINGLSCLALASIFLINPLILHHQISLVIDALKHASNQFIRANLSFDTPSTLAISIYSLFYLLYILYPNILRRELQVDSMQITTNDTPINRLGIERVLLPLFYHFKLHPNIVCGTIESEKYENRWQNESWQLLIGNGDRYVVLDDSSTLIKRKEEKSNDATRFEIGQVVRMCNEYTESVLHPSDMQSQIVQNTLEHHYSKKLSNDCSSIYSDSHCQTFEQQWQTTIQNGQMNLSRFQASNESIEQNNGKDSTAILDQNIHAKVQLQLDMLDCNYEQDKREYYAQLIRDTKKTLSIHDLDRDLKDEEKLYQELINHRKQKSTSMDDVRKRINGFYQLNEAFHISLSATQVKLNTDNDEHWQHHSNLQQKQSKLKQEIEELETAKMSIENEIRDIQRRLFQSKTDAEQSIEIQQTIKQLYIDLNCARKKHQLLHNAFLNIKFKSPNVDKLIVMYQDQTEQDEKVLDEKKQKFEQLKQLLEKQQIDLTTKRNSFHQLRNMNTHKISTIRRQIDSIRICQTQLNMNSQIRSK